MVVSCPKCGEINAIQSYSNGIFYCPECDYTFWSNMTIRTNANKEFYCTTGKYSELQLPQQNKLNINAKSIIINDNKISITIDKDNIDKFDVIEINGVQFVRRTTNG